jgi:16S rRNA (adenine1518-N6/adenine1519-N6)-dimethyltransferase
MAEKQGRAKRSLGQNFLVDQQVIERIVSASGIAKGDTVIEIGPGRGALTDSLRLRAQRLILIEKDDHLAEKHKRRFAEDEDVRILNLDALVVRPGEMPFEGPYRVVANLPYNVGGRITMHLLEEWCGQVLSATLMFQREVANRLIAPAGSSSYGALSVLVQSFAEVWSLFGVPPGAFRPRPKIQSRVVRLRPFEQPLWAGLDYEHFRRVVHGGFAARRKTLSNSLQISGRITSSPEEIQAAIEQAGIDPGVRGDALPVEAWVRLAAALPPQV